MNAVVLQLPALQVVVPLLGAVLVAFFRKGLPAYLIALAVSWVMLVISIMLLMQVLATGTISYAMGGWPPPWGIEYRIDLLNAFVLVLVSGVGAVTMPYARRSVAFEIDEGRQAWFYCMYLLALTGLLGIAATGDAFNAFVFLEVSSLSSYVMIALGRDRRALLAAYQYLIMGTIGATFYVLGIGILYLLTGTLNIADMAVRLGPLAADQWRAVIVALAFITVGISLKLALFPLHVWLPNAYAYAPSFATAFLAGTATKVAVYLLIRFYYSVFDVAIDFTALRVNEILVVLAIAAMFATSFVAVFESNIKRMLAYSSIAQIGYIIFGIGLADQAGLTGSLVHLFNHAVMKTALFLAIGAAFLRTGTVQLNDLAGIGRRMPLTMVTFAIAGFGIIGVPGTAGFISKWYFAIGAYDKGWWPLVFVIVASSLIAIVYIGRVLEVMFFRPPLPSLEKASDPPLSMLLPIVILGLATIYFGFETEWTVGIASKAAQALLGGAP